MSQDNVEVVRALWAGLNKILASRGHLPAATSSTAGYDSASATSGSN